MSRRLITTDGSTLFRFSNSKRVRLLKNDLLNHFLWRSSKNNIVCKTKKLRIFKDRFLKS